jgi:hypothetical protein
MARETDRPPAVRRARLRTLGLAAVVAAIPLALAAQPPKRITKSSAGDLATTSPAARPAVDSGAVAVVRRMGEFLRTLRAFRLHVESSTDEVLVAGPKIQFNRTSDLVVRRPDRLRVDVRGDDVDRQLFYDGKSLTVYGKRLNYYATAPAPSRLDSLLDVLMNRYGVAVPVADLLYDGAHNGLLSRVRAGVMLGSAFVAGAECDHLAFHQEGVDWQLWVERGERPLPRKLVITTLDETSQPQHEAVLTWDLAPAIDDSLFAFVPPADAGRIVLAETGRGAPPATKPK